MTKPHHAFAPLIGLPCWQVQQGVGSFLTLEFGIPHLRIAEPLRFRGSEKRRVTIAGEWHVWIYCCEWVLSNNGRDLVNSDDERADIAEALDVLDGQALESVEIDASNANTTFRFDLGGELSTRRAPTGTYDEEPVDQWLLYQPNGDVLSLQSDGTYTTESGSETR